MSKLEEVETILYNRNQYYEEEEETDAIDWLIKRVKDLEEENLVIYKEGNYFKERMERYKQALEFYADKINYQIFIRNGRSNIEHDQGEKARQALGEGE